MNNSNAVRFEEIHFHNYGVLVGTQKFVFNHPQTLIVGGNGTGKTTILNALAHLGPAPDIQPNDPEDAQEVSVEVVTSGNRELVQNFESIIFLGGDNFGFRNMNALYGWSRNALEGEIRNIFQRLLVNKPFKIELYKDLDQTQMATGEKVCLNYAFVFSVRKALNLDIPLVIDSPYDYLDLELRQGLCTFLNEQKCQKILLLRETESAELYEEYENSYTLVSQGVSIPGLQV